MYTNVKHAPFIISNRLVYESYEDNEYKIHLKKVRLETLYFFFLGLKIIFILIYFFFHVKDNRHSKQKKQI